MFTDSDVDIGFDVCVLRRNEKGERLPQNRKCQLHFKSINNQLYIHIFHSHFKLAPIFYHL